MCFNCRIPKNKTKQLNLNYFVFVDVKITQNNFFYTRVYNYFYLKKWKNKKIKLNKKFYIYFKFFLLPLFSRDSVLEKPRYQPSSAPDFWFNVYGLFLYWCFVFCDNKTLKWHLLCAYFLRAPFVSNVR